MKISYCKSLTYHGRRLNALDEVEEVVDKMVQEKIRDVYEEKQANKEYKSSDAFTKFFFPIFCIQAIMIEIIVLFAIPSFRNISCLILTLMAISTVICTVYLNDLTDFWNCLVYGGKSWYLFASTEDKILNDVTADVQIPFGFNQNNEIYYSNSGNIYRMIYLTGFGKTKILKYDSDFIRFSLPEEECIDIPMEVILLKKVQKGKKPYVDYEGEFLTLYLKKKDYKKLKDKQKTYR